MVVSHLFTAISLQKESKLVAVKHARLKLDVHRRGLGKEDSWRTGRGGLHLVGWGESKLLLGLVVIQNVIQTALDQIANTGLHVVGGKLYDLSHGFSLQELIHRFLVVACPNEQIGMRALANNDGVGNKYLPDRGQVKSARNSRDICMRGLRRKTLRDVPHGTCGREWRPLRVRLGAPQA